jgi:predicted PurR-regulated permease PerM
MVTAVVVVVVVVVVVAVAALFDSIIKQIRKCTTHSNGSVNKM